jgi:hypothetical protein
MNPLHMSKDTKQTLLSGIAGGLIFHMEEAANGLVPGYPQFLKDRLNPSLPRNGQLVADVGPLATVWVVGKKRRSARMDNIKIGMTLYDLPKLLHQIVWNVAYQAGVPAAGLRLANARYMAPATLNIRPIPMNNRAASQPPRLSKYAVTGTPPVMSGVSGAGKYKAVA